MTFYLKSFSIGTHEHTGVSISASLQLFRTQHYTVTNKFEMEFFMESFLETWLSLFPFGEIIHMTGNSQS